MTSTEQYLASYYKNLFRVFDSLIMKKMLTGPIKPVLFLSKFLFYSIAIFSNL